MRPLHVGLLVIGAALAGGLAVKMSQPPSYRASARAAAQPASPVAAPLTSPVRPAPPATANPDPAGASATLAPPARYQEERPRAITAKPLPAKISPAKISPSRIVSAAPPAPAPAPPAEVAKVETPAPQPVPYEAPGPERTVAAQPVFPDPAPQPTPPAAPTPPAPLQVSLHQGTSVAVRLDQALSSDHLFPGDSFQASLAEPLVAGGYVIAERGARVSGRVVASKNAGRLSGTSELELSLTSLHTADGQRINITTEPWSRRGDSGRGQEAAKIGGGAALGAIIGAIAGGGKGAAIGAGVGGAAGTGVAAANRGKPVTIPSETVLYFRLAARVTVTERQL